MILLVIHSIIENRDFSSLDNVQLEARGLSNTLYVVSSGEVSHFDDISELSCEEVPLWVFIFGDEVKSSDVIEDETAETKREFLLQILRYNRTEKVLTIIVFGLDQTIEIKSNLLSRLTLDRVGPCKGIDLCKLSLPP